MVQMTLKIDGMQCGMCESHVNDTLRAAFPLKKVSSSHSKGETVLVTAEEIPEDALRRALEPTGYKLVSVQSALCQARPVPPRLTRLPVARSRSRGAFLFARRVVCCIQNAALHDFERRKRTWRSGKRSASFALPEI